MWARGAGRLAPVLGGSSGTSSLLLASRGSGRPGLSRLLSSAPRQRRPPRERTRQGRRAAKPAEPRVVRVPELCTADRLASELRTPVSKLLALSESLGEPLDSPSRPLPSELLELLAMESGVSLHITPVDAQPRPAPSAEERAALPLRPPVVTLMGHVDHGKTSLLDAFRGSQIADGEAGGITQAITAFTVDAGSEQAITFIDTPGHELFAAMRQRGANATDIVVLVVAVDAGVQPTTVQAIEYARELRVPVVVAANKIDREGAKAGLAKLATQLMSHGIIPEDSGGDVPVVGVSATKRLHLDELREQVLLQAEMLELHEEVEGAAEGVVIEAAVHKGLGVVSSVLVQRGTLKPGDVVVAGTAYGKVRAMLSTDDGKTRLKRAPPSTPLRLAGLKELPRTGDELLVVPSEARAREVVEFRKAKATLSSALDGHMARRSLMRTEVKLVPAMLKADTAGSLEAVAEGIAHFPTDRVKLKLVSQELGPVSEADVQLASTLGAALLGFNVPASTKVEAVAERAGVPLHSHRVIYELVDAVKEVLEEAIEPIFEESVIGTATVKEKFELTNLSQRHRKEGMAKLTAVAGSKVSSGEARASGNVKVLRDGAEVHDGKVVSLKRFKDEVRAVRTGQECGIVLHDYGDFEVDDVLSFYEVVPRKPGLYDALEEEE